MLILLFPFRKSVIIYRIFVIVIKDLPLISTLLVSIQFFVSNVIFLIYTTSFLFSESHFLIAFCSCFKDLILFPSLSEDIYYITYHLPLGHLNSCCFLGMASKTEASLKHLAPGSPSHFKIRLWNTSLIQLCCHLPTGRLKVGKQCPRCNCTVLPKASSDLELV